MPPRKPPVCTACLAAPSVITDGKVSLCEVCYINAKQIEEKRKRGDA